MADFLGNLLGSMAGPPKASEKELAERKKAREMAKKMEEKNKQDSKVFRQKMETRIDEFVKLPIGEEKNRRLTFEPMPKYHRSVINDVAEVAGLVAHSFGEEDVDRHVCLWRKEFSPCEDELEAFRQGIEWDPVQNAREKYETARRLQQEQDEDKKRRKTEKNFVPKQVNYQHKYEHLIGNESALAGAKELESNKSYGMVSAEEKKDKRTMEQIQADIRAKKRLKPEPEVQQQTNS